MQRYVNHGYPEENFEFKINKITYFCQVLELEVEDEIFAQNKNEI